MKWLMVVGRTGIIAVALVILGALTGDVRILWNPHIAEGFVPECAALVAVAPVIAAPPTTISGIEE